MKKYRRGFTLIELLVVMSIVGILASIVIVAVNPRKQFLATRDAGRKQNVGEIVSAINQYIIDQGKYPDGSHIPEGVANAKPLCKHTISAAECNANDGVNLSALAPTYIHTLPVDSVMPENANCTGYMVYQSDSRPHAFSANIGKLPGNTPLGMCGFIAGTTPGITVSPTSGLTTTEAGGTATFTMVLTMAPTADVSVTVTSSDTTESLVSNGVTTAVGVTFIFTTGNWNSAQTVTAIGQDDVVDDDDVVVTLTTAVASIGDPGYNGLSAPDVTATNTDDDTGPPTCNGQNATIYVDGSNMIVGGPNNGVTYVAGTTILLGAGAADIILGTSAGDSIQGVAGVDTICGLGGNDTIDSGNGDDTVFGGEGNDTINGGKNTDTICGEGGDDTITGDKGNDLIDGDAGSDTIDGGDNPDTCVNGEVVSNCTTTTGTVPACD